MISLTTYMTFTNSIPVILVLHSAELYVPVFNSFEAVIAKVSSSWKW